MSYSTRKSPPSNPCRSPRWPKIPPRQLFAHRINRQLPFPSPPRSGWQRCKLTIQHPIDIARTTPLLMGEDVAADCLLLLLDQLDVGEHAFRFVALGELGCWVIKEGGRERVRRWEERGSEGARGGGRKMERETISARRSKGKEAAGAREDVPVTTAVLCSPASEMSWRLNPTLPKSQTNDLSCSLLNPWAPQLKEGERL